MFPILFNSSYFTLYAYPLFMGLAWGAGFSLTTHLLEQKQLSTKNLHWLYLGVFLTAWFGAKIFFITLSDIKDINHYLYNDNFWLGGGFVFYGGLICGLLFYLFYSLVLKKFPFEQTQYLVPGVAFGHAIGRVGCFFTGCCFGSQCDLPWAVHMHGHSVHPVQLYETAGLLLIGFLSINWVKKQKGNLFIMARYLILYSSLRFIVEFFRGDTVRGLYWFNLSTSQYISLLLLVAGIILLCLPLLRKAKKE